MASETELVFTRRTASKVTRCQFICPQCGPCSFEIHLESKPTPKKIEFATALVFKAHQQEHK